MPRKTTLTIAKTERLYVLRQDGICIFSVPNDNTKNLSIVNGVGDVVAKALTNVNVVVEYFTLKP